VCDEPIRINNNFPAFLPFAVSHRAGLRVSMRRTRPRQPERALSEPARDNHLYARAMVGRDFTAPAVEAVAANGSHFGEFAAA
jgi:hypothetical protein